MFNFLKKYFNSRNGNLIENIIYLIIIGALTFSFYTDKFQTPMNASIDELYNKIEEWTKVNE